VVREAAEVDCCTLDVNALSSSGPDLPFNILKYCLYFEGHRRKDDFEAAEIQGEKVLHWIKVNVGLTTGLVSVAVDCVCVEALGRWSMYTRRAR
jgi:hypothetical protein